MVYKWHFSCQLGDGLCHRSHLLGEPETTIDKLLVMDGFDGRPWATSLWWKVCKRPLDKKTGDLFQRSMHQRCVMTVTFFVGKLPVQKKNKWFIIKLMTFFNGILQDGKKILLDVLFEYSLTRAKYT